jgi:hypothetical protein
MSMKIVRGFQFVFIVRSQAAAHSRRSRTGRLSVAVDPLGTPLSQGCTTPPEAQHRCEKDSEIHDIISRYRRAQTKDAEGKMGSFGICA